MLNISGYRAEITIECTSGTDTAKVTLNLGGPMGRGEDKNAFSERVARDLRKLLSIWSDENPKANEEMFQMKKELTQMQKDMQDLTTPVPVKKKGPGRPKKVPA